MRSRSDSELAQWILEHNARQSAQFVADERKRKHYRVDHPTQFIALKCMDGRVNMAVCTETLPGVIQPFRNLGGKFNPAWHHFGSLLARKVKMADTEERACVIAQTYHWSHDEKNRGCRGFKYDVDAARAYTLKMKKRLEEVFTNRSKVYPIRMGFETDLEALVLHNDAGDVLDMRRESGCTEGDLRDNLLKLFPDMGEMMIQDFIPLLLGNQRHVEKVKKEARTIIQQDHCERMLGYGRGFDWFHTPNLAFIVGPYDTDLLTPIFNAIRLLHENRESCRVASKDGLVLMTSAIYRDERDDGIDRNLARARTLHDFNMVVKVIKDQFPDMLDLFAPLIGIVNHRTQKFELVEEI